MARFEKYCTMPVVGDEDLHERVERDGQIAEARSGLVADHGVVVTPVHARAVSRKEFHSDHLI